MLKSLKILPFLLLLISGSQAEPKQLTNFVQILDALNSGYRVNAVFHYKDCKLISDSVETKAPDAIGGMDVLPFEYFAPGVIGKRAFISSSETVMIYLGGGGGYFYNYVKLRVYDDNTVEITARYLTTDKLEVKMDEKFSGEINDGTNGKPIYFYAN